MAYQFVHLETYARKADSKGRSVAWVLSEAAREPGASPHVSAPEPPQVIHGVNLNEVRRLHDDACEGARVTLTNGKTRAVRRDQKSLLTVVASHPATMDQVRAEPAVADDVAAWERRTANWLRAQYGDELLSIVRHTDESHPHLHAYILPDDLRAARLHPGAEAKRMVTAAGPAEGEDPKTLNKRGDQAYRTAMRAWQDSYHEHVGIPSGLARLGPGRRRLTRDEWQAEKAAAMSTKRALDWAARIDAQGQAFVAKTRSAAASTIAAAQETVAAAEQRVAAAKALHDAAINTERGAKTLQAAAEAQERKASIILDRAGNQAERIVAQAVSKASRISSWGGRLRALWDGLRKTSIAAAARREAAREVARERARADDAQRRLLEETLRRQEADRRAQGTLEALRSTAAERDVARHELAALRPAAPALTAGRRLGR